MQISRSRPLRYTFWTLVALFFLFCALVPEWLRVSKRADRAGAVTQQGLASVTTFIPPPLNHHGIDFLSSKPPEAALHVRFRGQIYPVKETLGLSSTTDKDGQEHYNIVEGQTVRIYYVVGKSGRIYIDVAEPLH